MWLLAFYVWISLLIHVLASDTTGQQNDIIPDQALEIPYGMFCFFTMSELMFKDRMQQVAPSAYRVGAARLSDMKVISSTSYGYENLWGAFYFAQREDYSSIIQYARSRDKVAFVSTMEIETIENESGLCVLTDVGLQPNTYPSTQDCSQCYGSGGSSNMPSATDYQQELASMGVPATYFQAMGKLPTTQQNPSGNASAQMPGSSSTPSLGASAALNTPPLGASVKGNLSPTPSLGASAAAQTPPLGATAQGNLSPNPSLAASATGPTPSPQGGNNDQGQGTGYKHQLRGPSSQSVVSPPPTPPNAQPKNQPTSTSPQPNSPSTGSLGTGLSGGIYQPQTNFSGGSGGGGNQQQSSLTAGFSFASYSGQYSFLSGQCGNSFMNN